MPLRPPHRTARLLHLVAADDLERNGRLRRLRSLGGAAIPIPRAFAGHGRLLAFDPGLRIAGRMIGMGIGVAIRIPMLGRVRGFRLMFGRRSRQGLAEGFAGEGKGIRLVGLVGSVVMEFRLLHRLAVHLFRRRVMRHGFRNQFAPGLLMRGFTRIGGGFGFAVGFERGLAVGDRDAVIVGMNLVEGEETVAVAPILDECRLERRLHPRHLGEIDVTLDLLLG